MADHSGASEAGAGLGSQARRPDRAPARPLLQIALALALGCTLGAFAQPARASLLLATSALGATWLTWRLATAANAAGAGRRTSVDAGLLLLVALLGALRASPRPALHWNENVYAWQGTWVPQGESASQVRGAFATPGPAQARFELPRGAARAGETLRILRGARPTPQARGPLQRGANAAFATWDWIGESEEDSLPQEAGNARVSGEVICAAADEVLRLSSPRERLPWLDRGRDYLQDSTRSIQDPAAAALARAFLLGDSSALNADSADLFARNGLLHVLAVSGWHVAMLAWMLVRPLAWLCARLAARFPRARHQLDWGLMLLCVMLCIAYVPIAGGGAPLRRSAIAVALAATAAFWPRHVDPSAALVVRSRRLDALSLWSAALIVECWLDPAALGNLGVQLSYAATLGLIVATGALQGVLLEWSGLRAGTRPDDLLQSWPRQCASALVRRLPRLMLGGIAASIAAVAATAPVIWLSFGEACAWGVLTTPLLAPLFALLFTSGMLLLLWPAEFLVTLFTASSHALLAALRAFDVLPGTPTLLPARPAWLLCATLLAAWLLLSCRQHRVRHRLALRAGAALGTAALLLPWSPSASGFELHLLDVGHGTAAVFRAPGEPCWIFDCGSRDRSGVARGALAPLLRSWEVNSASVVLSHLDNDHCGGLRWVVERTPPDLWVGAVPAPLSERLAHTCSRLDLPQGCLVLPEAGPNLTLTLLRGQATEGNEGSRSLWIGLPSRAVLLCGDAVDEGWALPLREGLLAAAGGLLLAPHHGSRDGRVGEVLDAFQPARVWISGSGRPPLATELDRRHVPWDSTQSGGPLRWAWP